MPTTAEPRKSYTRTGVEFAWHFLPGVYDEVFTRNANQITAALKVGWHDAGTLKADMMESASHVVGQKWLVRSLPHQCPEADRQYLVSLKKRELLFDAKRQYPNQAYDEVTGWFSVDFISYIATYGNLPYDLKDDDAVKTLAAPELNRYVSIFYESIKSNRKVSSYPFVLDDTGVAIKEAATVPEILRRITVKQWMWPKAAVNWNVIDDRSGKVNDVAFTLGGQLCPMETLLYEGLAGTPEEYTGADGERYLDLMHVFTKHPVNWNKTYDTATATWKYFKVQGTVPAQRRFPLASMTEVFVPL